MSHFWSDVFSILFAIASILLVFIVLLQRGRGGGLAGAFGATGGQSAFGTKAGDVFTRITIGVAFVWVALAGITGAAMTRESAGRFQSQAQAPLEPEVVPANPAQVGQGAGGGGFDAGDQQNNKAGAATKAGTPTTGTASAKTSSPAPTPPAKSSPAPNATKSSAPGK